MSRFRARSGFDVPASDLWAWHLRRGAFERLNPGWDPAEVVDRGAGVSEGSQVVLRVRMGPLRRRWVARHRGLVEGREFRDDQVSGPFAHWSHAHRFLPAERGGATLSDEIEYALPGGLPGALIGGRLARAKLRRLFTWRHAVTRGDLLRHRGHPGKLRVAVSGAGGLVGSALTAFLSTGGHEVVRMVRRPPTAADEVYYDPAAGEIDAQSFEGLDAVVHLAGENIAAGRWTPERKRRIRESRVHGTRLVAEALAGLRDPPRVLINASAIGFYGDRGEEKLDETSSPGEGFLPEVCRAWEAAAEPAEQAGIRVVKLRIGVVLAAGGGALAKLLLPFSLGLGGPVGAGRQFMSWVALDDLVGAIHHLLYSEEVAGPVNAVAPAPCRNRDFALALGRVLKRPAVLPTPAFLLRLALGEMARELLLAGNRIYPARLEASGFRFLRPELDPALRFELGRLDPAAERVELVT